MTENLSPKLRHDAGKISLFNSAPLHVRLVTYSIVLVLSLSAAMGHNHEVQSGKIVGLGAASCSEFLGEIGAKPSLQVEYLAWAQGYMSALLLTRPPPIDRGLDLMPGSFRLMQQLKFLRDSCASRPEASFADAVESLYQRLRLESSI